MSVELQLHKIKICFVELQPPKRLLDLPILTAKNGIGPER